MKLSLLVLAIILLTSFESLSKKSRHFKKQKKAKSLHRHSKSKLKAYFDPNPEPVSELMQNPSNYKLLNPLEYPPNQEIKRNDPKEYYDQKGVNLNEVKKGETVLVGNMSVIKDTDFDPDYTFKKQFPDARETHLPINQKDQKPYYNPINESANIHKDSPDNVFHVPIESERDFLEEQQGKEKLRQQLVSHESKYYYDSSHLQKPEDHNLTSIEKTLKEQKEIQEKEKTLGKSQKLSDWEKQEEETQKNIQATLGYKEKKYNGRQQFLMNQMNQAENERQNQERQQNLRAGYYKESTQVKANSKAPYYNAAQK